ncbi:aminoglycoside phosphotransferase family protein [Paraburkholderia sediminicola]|uniref:aminoglycoside phosphotransferase family protein n=1 Tax=Paraburkholderia sediminicola TaxID=458836 RepID=UPI0038B93706
MPLQSVAIFDDYLRRWELFPDGSRIVTRSSQLLPVKHRGELAMLKVAVIDEEKRGNAMMAWRNGSATARVLAYDQDAILMERASGELSLSELSRSGHDNGVQLKPEAVLGNTLAAIVTLPLCGEL